MHCKVTVRVHASSNSSLSRCNHGGSVKGRDDHDERFNALSIASKVDQSHSKPIAVHALTVLLMCARGRRMVTTAM